MEKPRPKNTTKKDMASPRLKGVVSSLSFVSRPTEARNKRPIVGGTDSGKSTKRPAHPIHPRTRSALPPKTEASPSWEKVAEWYDDHLEQGGTYHEHVLLPNLLRLVDPKKGDVILDVACGQGYFTRAFATKGAQPIGIDISEHLIAIARERSPLIDYRVASAEKLDTIKNNSIDTAVIVLAIQNIEQVSQVSSEMFRVLKPGGVFHVVMNHPAFRVPKRSAWGYDDKRQLQHRRVEQYLSETRAAIDMHPGVPGSPQTLSFHRPLQYYFKILMKSGFVVDRLEEWISHKSSDSGPRAKAENIARKEIPLFLYLRAKKGGAH